MTTLFGVQYGDGSAATVQDLERAKAIVSYDPARRKVVKLTVEDYVPPKKYKWKVTMNRTTPAFGVANVYHYEGLENTRAQAEAVLKTYADTILQVEVKKTVEEIDG